MEYKSFANHRHNGVFLKFPNGNTISTIWGRGCYGDNYDFSTGDLAKDYSTLIPQGADRVEIMIGTDNKRLHNKIFRKLDTDPDNGVMGWVNITDWLWVINQLSKVETKNATIK